MDIKKKNEAFKEDIEDEAFKKACKTLNCPEDVGTNVMVICSYAFSKYIKTPHRLKMRKLIRANLKNLYEIIVDELLPEEGGQNNE